jgi:hypothetical protein
MSQPGMNLKNMKMPTVSSGMIGGVVFFLVIVIVLYYIYSFLYTSAGVQASLNLIPSNVLDTASLKNGGIIRCDAVKGISASPPSSVSPSSTASPTPAVEFAVAQKVGATGLTSGGQYTVSMWLSVYSTSPQTSGTATLPLLDITSIGKTLLFIGLTPTNGTLVVHQGTGEASDGQVNVYGRMSSVSPSSASTYTGTDKCNIVNGIEYQRWVLINVVANGRTLDVYIDGKLSRSCVYNGLNNLGVENGTATITVGRQNATTGKINGVFSTTDYYNYALTPDIIWSLYQAGPAMAGTGKFFSNMFNTNIDLSMGIASS